MATDLVQDTDGGPGLAKSKDSLFRIGLALVGLILVFAYLFYVIGHLSNSLDRGATRLGSVTLPLVNGPVAVERNGS